MAVFEMESWYVAEGKEEEHRAAMRQWLQWVNDHRELFPEWKSVRYFVKSVAGDASGRHFVMWEYDSLADFEAYKQRRADYEGPVPGVQGERPLLQKRIHPPRDGSRVLARYGKRPDG